MPWIKKNIDKVALLVASILLIAVSVFFYLKAQSFAETNGYEGVQAIVEGTAKRDNKIEPLDPKGTIAKARNDLNQSVAWETPGTTIPLMVAAVHLLVTETDGRQHIELAGSEGIIHDPIPNKWINQYDLDITETDLKNQDPDLDRFSNLDEWRGMDPRIPDTVKDRESTNPKDAKSHPPYTTKLYLQKAVEVPLQIVFTGTPDDGTSFFINAGGTSQLLQIGDFIVERPANEQPRKRFKILGFKAKMEKHPTLEMNVDVSELQIENTENGEKVVMVKDRPVNSPDSFAIFYFDWDKTTLPQIKKGATFFLKPEESVIYKLIDIQKDKAVIIDEKTQKKFDILPRSTQP